MTTVSMPLVSFVVPCYNYSRYLGDCLKSIFDQQGGYEFEIVAVDDGSTDHTQDVLASFADPRLRVITHGVNLGHVRTINEGLREAGGRYIARIDPDDRYRPWFLTTLVEKFRAFPGVGLVYGDAAMINERGEITAESCDHVHGGGDFQGNEFLDLLENNFLCAPTAIARRELWHKALPIPEGMAFSDWYFNVVMARISDFYYVNRVVADYRVHPLNHHSKIVLDRTEEGTIFRLLDWSFGQPESDPEMERRKQALRGRIYGAWYLRAAEKYFGAGMYPDARRCYLRAARHWPACALRSSSLRHFAGTFLSPERYESSKNRIKAVLRG